MRNLIEQWVKSEYNVRLAIEPPHDLSSWTRILDVLTTDTSFEVFVKNDLAYILESKTP
jgi:hypothetical protein